MALQRNENEAREQGGNKNCEWKFWNQLSNQQSFVKRDLSIANYIPRMLPVGLANQNYEIKNKLLPLENGN